MADIPDIRLHLIAYDEASRALCEPGYTVLDNQANERPDWREYWPMRRFLLSERLDEQAWYGFFSPKFASKTGLSHAQTRSFIEQAAPTSDVVCFSPQFDMGAFFLNVFEQAETFDPGFLAATQQWLSQAGWQVNLSKLVMDSRQVVFSNFFVARPAFWREWLHWNEQLFAVCEGPDSALRRSLVAPTMYDGYLHPHAVQRKVFLMERIASLLLATQPQWRTTPHNPMRFAWSDSRLSRFPAEALVCDALKMALRDRGWSEYLGAFGSMRKRFLETQDSRKAA